MSLPRLSLLFACLALFAWGCSIEMESSDNASKPHLPDGASSWFDTADIGADIATDSGDNVDTTALPDQDAVDTFALDTALGEDTALCQEGSLRCSLGSAERCVNGDWHSEPACPLGCDESLQSCYLASNVDLALLDPEAAALDLSGVSGELRINTDTGSIEHREGVVRPEGESPSDDVHIGFQRVDQGGGGPPLGVFSTGELLIPADVKVRAYGDAGLVIVASGDIYVAGLIDVSALGRQGGPGGNNGGGAESRGEGYCPGESADGGLSISGRWTPGGGGGGFGGRGGDGGDGDTLENEELLPGGTGGGPCGDASLSPLVGGSGGGGGGFAEGDLEAIAGVGGGGGGAIQLLSSTSITFAENGGIWAAGDGGGESHQSGGGGGGAGGGILLEAPIVNTAPTSVLAANGGGGGAGDCT